MWLLPLFPRVARLAGWVYYRIRYRGSTAPPAGPVLLLANHPNSLLDPVLVAAAARRPVRFLAKAPLFTDRKVGWLVRASGAIPVHRRQDDPSQVGRNEEMFRAVHAALADGAAVALFPEGISHSEPSLAPLRTGAARIALGAAPLVGAAFPIVPVGLVFRQKDVFRSDALVLVGDPLTWQDLADRGVDDGEAMRELTARIEAALRQQTVNLAAWRDEPLVEAALRIWDAEADERLEPAVRVRRAATVTGILAEIRAVGDPAGTALIHDVTAHRRRLARLGLRPADLTADTSGRRALAWAASRAWLLLPVWILPGIIGWAIFLPPYRLTGIVVDRFPLETDVRSTWKLMLGAVSYLAWVVLLAVAVGWRWGRVAGLAALVAIPALGMIGLLVRERWRGAWGEARRWLVLRNRRSLVQSLRTEQRRIAAELVNRYHDFLRRGP